MKKHIIVITTGGTIAMKTDPVTGGLVPAVSGEDLAAAVPGLSSWADVDVVEFSNVPSGWMDTEKMLSLARTIDGLADKADGFVVTPVPRISLRTAPRISSPRSASRRAIALAAWASSFACRTASMRPST